MAVVFSVWRGPHLSVPSRRRVTSISSRRQHECGWSGGCCGLFVSAAFVIDFGDVRLCRCSNPTGVSC